MSRNGTIRKLPINGNHNGSMRNGNGGTAVDWYAPATHKNTGVAVPVVLPQHDQESFDPEFEAIIHEMLERIGEDPSRDGLQKTPLRVAKSMDFLTSGYRTSVDEVVNGAIFDEDAEDMVLVKDIEFYSMCEHHMLPFYGKAHVAYVPNGKIIGLSKLARIVDVFARRLQVQERLTSQVAQALEELLEPQGVAVTTDAAHFCMMMRGVQKQGSTTLTSAFRGSFKEDQALRQQYLDMITG
jgi:GTP cyclohydrolase IA